jgi:hypothetical protein
LANHLGCRPLDILQHGENAVILGLDPCRRERSVPTRGPDRRRFFGGGGGGTNTVTQNANPWPGAVSQINKGLNSAVSLYNANPEGPSYYPGNIPIPASRPHKEARLEAFTTTARAATRRQALRTPR